MVNLVTCVVPICLDLYLASNNIIINSISLLISRCTVIHTKLT